MNKNRIKRISTLLLALVMVMSLFSGLAVTAADTQATSNMPGRELSISLSESQLTALKSVDREGSPSGLVGFDEETAEEAAFDDGELRIIVELEQRPAAVEVAFAEQAGESLSFARAERLAEENQREFMSDLGSLFASDRRSSSAYRITAEYTEAINGVAMIIPEDKLEEIAALDTVYAVYPDLEMFAHEDKTQGTPDLIGMADTREYLGIDDIHAEGVEGSGVVVGVIDTGVDYNHPDLQDAFSSTNPGTGDLQPINGKYYGRNLFDYSLASLQDFPERSPYDPMETTYAEWKQTSYPEVQTGVGEVYTSHGTHVSGTIAARGVNEPDAALGMAPEATLLVYRVLGPYGRGYSSFTLAALEKVHEDGCDVVNMSLGANINTPYNVSSVAVNNLVIAHDIVFAISAGNEGPDAGSLGSPGTASLAVTVGNGTVGSYSYSTLLTGPQSSSASAALLFNDGSVVADEGNAGYWKGKDGLDFSTKDLALIKKVDSGVGESISVWNAEVGMGTAMEFEAANVISSLAGKIAVVYRGQAFMTTAKLAKQYGMAALIVINNKSETLGYMGRSVKYVPTFLTADQSSAVSLFSAATEAGEKIAFTNRAMTLETGGTLNYSSSRGPTVGGELKPDIVAPGTNVVSTVPFFMTADDRQNPAADGAYVGAYMSYTGTSMSAPHIAGISALIVGKYQGISALEVKTRMTNTANLMPKYSVHETGMGYVNPKKALAANGFVSAQNNSVAVSVSDGMPTETTESVAAVTFGTMYTGESSTQERSCQLTIRNNTDAAKTFTMSYVKKLKAEEVSSSNAAVATSANWSSALDSFTFSNGSVVVPAKDEANFNAKITMKANLDPNLVGIYEGYIKLVNQNDATEEYKVPFSAILESKLLDEDSTYMNPPVMTSNGVTIQRVKQGDKYVYEPAITSSLVHSEHSISTVINLRTLKTVSTIEVIYAAGDAVNPANTAYHLGTAGYLAPSSGLPAGEYMVEGFNIMYVSNLTGVYTLLQPGDYKMVICNYSKTGKEYAFAGDFIVDNAAPELTVDDMTDNKIVYDSEDKTKAEITGNLYDVGTQHMIDAGIKYNFLLESVPNQAFNAIFARVKGTSDWAYGSIEQNGDFTFEMEGLSASGLTKVELYYFDSFTPRLFYFPDEGEIDADFNLEKPSFGSPYQDIFGAFVAYNGANKALKEITLQHSTYTPPQPPPPPPASEEYSVSYNANGGTGGSASITVEAGKEYVVLSAAAAGISNETETVKNKSFAGWGIEATDKAAKYLPGAKIYLEDDMVLYAIWEDGGSLNKTEQISYISGYDDDTVKPDNYLTRAQAAQMIMCLIEDKGKALEVKQQFPDVKPGAWYYEAVNYLGSIGILDGYSDGLFKPDRTVTRAEFVKIISAFDKLEESSDMSFTDVPDNWARPFIANAYARKWVGGYGDNTFRPNQTITRAEAARIINSMLGRKLSEEQLGKLDNPFKDLSESFWGYADIIAAAVDF